MWSLFLVLVNNLTVVFRITSNCQWIRHGSIPPFSTFQQIAEITRELLSPREVDLQLLCLSEVDLLLIRSFWIKSKHGSWKCLI